MSDYILSKRGKLWYAKIPTGERYDNGRMKYKRVSTGCSRKVDAETIAERWIQDGRFTEPEPGQPHSDELAVSRFFLDYWDADGEIMKALQKKKGKQFSPVFIRNSGRFIELYFLPWAKKHKLESIRDLTAVNLGQWFDDFIVGNLPEHGERAAKLTNVTRNKVRQAIVTSLTYAVRKGYIPGNPASFVERATETPRARKIYQLKELQELFNTQWTDPRAYGACMLAWNIGCRMGEARALTWQCVDLQRGTVSIMASWRDTDGLTLPKGGRDKEGHEKYRPNIPIWERTAEFLSMLGENSPHGTKVLNPDAKPEDQIYPFVFYSDDRARPVSRELILKNLRAAMTSAGLPADRDFHSFRHTWAHNAVLRGLPTPLVRSVLGHANQAMTDLYSNHESAEGRRLIAEYMKPQIE